MSITNKKIKNKTIITITEKRQVAIPCTLLYTLEQLTRVVTHSNNNNKNHNNSCSTHNTTRLSHTHSGYVDCLLHYCSGHEMSLPLICPFCLVNCRHFNGTAYLSYNQSSRSVPCLTFLCMLPLFTLPRTSNVLCARCHRMRMIIR